MKNSFKKATALLLVAVMSFGFAAAGITLKADAADSLSENGFVYTVTDEEATITGYENLSGDVVIPETLGGYPVTAIGKDAFKSCGMTSVYIPEGIVSIHGYPYDGYPGAFCYCSKLEKITVDEDNPNYSSDEYGVLYNREQTVLCQFPRNSAVTDFTVPYGVIEIDCYSFYNCNALKAVDTGHTAESVSLNTFYSCDELAYVNLGEGMTNIGTDAFSGCKKLSKVIFGDNVAQIHSHAFENCDGITEFNFPKGLTYVDDLAFFGCSSIEKITVDPLCENFSADEYGVLYGANETELVKFPPASDLTSYDIPDTVKTIRAFSFGFEAKNIEKITVGSGVELVGSLAFSDCSSLEEVIFENGTNALTFNNETFAYCTRLRNVVLPDNLTTCKYSDIFSGCTALESVTVGEGITKVNFLPSPKRMGCSFLGWYVDGEKIIQTYEKGSERITFTAMFDPMSYAVTLDAEGGIFADGKTSASCVFAAGDEITGLSEPSKGGFVFGGWDGIPENGIMPAESITLKAKWVPEETAGETLSIKLETNYFNADTNEWTPTTGIATDEQLKLRIYIDTSYYAGSGKFMFFYPDGKFGKNYGAGKTYPLSFNTDSQSSAAIAGASGTFTVVEPTDPMIQSLADGGYIDESMVGEYWAVIAEYNFTSSSQKCQKISGDTWFAEIDFTVGVRGAYDEFKVFPATAASPDNLGGYIDISVGTENGKIYDAVSLSEVNVEVLTENAVCNGAVCCSFHAGDGRFENGTWNFMGFGSIGDKVSVPDDPTREGYTFAGWADVDGVPAEVPQVRPRDSVAFYAIWVPNEYSIKYNIGKETVEYSVCYGSEVPVPDISQYGNIEFIEWQDKNGNKASIPSAMPAEELEFTAKIRIISKSEDFDITAIYDDDCFAEEVTLSVSEIDGSSRLGNVYLADGEYYYQIGYFNIKMVNAKSEVVQPQNGKKVTIKVPVPEGYESRSDFLINHWFTTGGREQISTDNAEQMWVENGYICFKTGKFSEFAIYAKSVTALSKLPDKTAYNYKESLDLSGIELTVINADGSTKTVTDTSKMTVSGFDSKKIGEQTVTVEYEGEIVEFTVNVSYAWWQWIIRILLLGFLWY